jgi:uncharacterized protein DUF5309
MLVSWQEFTANGRPQGGSIPEDLRDFVENASAKDRPALALFRKSRVGTTFVEWQEDSLPSRGLNAFVEGVAATDQNLTTPSRLFAHVQNFARWGMVSDVQRAVEHKGFGDAYLYQEKKCIDATLNDVEHALHRQSSITGATNAARQFQGLLNILTTSSNFTALSGVTLTESIFADLVQLFTDNNTEIRPNVCFVNSLLKRTISGFTTNVTRYVDVHEKLQQNVIERHASDFGDVDIYFSRDQLKSATKTGVGNSLVLLDPSFFEVGFLQSLMSETLARGGLRTQFQISAMCTLIYRTALSIGGTNNLASGL